MTIHYEGALTKIQADQILSNFLGKAKVTEKIFSLNTLIWYKESGLKTVPFFPENLIFQNMNQR